MTRTRSEPSAGFRDAAIAARKLGSSSTSIVDTRGLALAGVGDGEADAVGPVLGGRLDVLGDPADDVMDFACCGLLYCLGPGRGSSLFQRAFLRIQR